MALLGLALAGPLGAHEYWLDPLDATPDAGGPLFVDIRNGEGFAGDSFPFDPSRIARLELVGADGVRALSGRLGDYPAVRAELDRPGLYLVVLETRAASLRYDDRAAFATFLDYHGLGALLDVHRERGLPEEGIRERYFRYAKALLKAGDAAAPLDPAAPAAPALAPLGQRLELVPANDPYVDDALTLTLALDGEAVADAQLELFERAPDGAVSRVIATTGADGGASFDIGRRGDYLVNAVRVLEPAAGTPDAGTPDAGTPDAGTPDAGTPDAGTPDARTPDARTPDADASAPPHWVSLWASLTFEKR